VREVVGLAAAHRLVTLTGAGGIGKTRLALEAARTLLPDLADGVFAAELAPLADSDLIPATIAAAVGLELAGAASPESVAHALSDRRILLVLDNCEHVIDAATTIAEALLRANPALRLIATSREPFRTEGEWVYPVPPLGIPAEQPEDDDDPLRYGAVQLFLERARSADPRFALDRRQAAMAAAICRRLDGIPLALELAAARVAALGIEEIAMHLDDRFELLTGGRRTALPRHRTLRHALDWSFDLLPELERVLLRRLSVFAGRFTLEAVRAVGADAELAPCDLVEGLTNLIAKSLLLVEVEDTVARYRLLETTRIYALEKLGESGERGRLLRRHAEHYQDLFGRAESEWKRGPRPNGWRHIGA
jgi:predicted ATPase